MKKLLIAGIAAVSFCGAPAVAADMSVKGGPAVYDWTGAYWGLNDGYGSHDPKVNFSATGDPDAGGFVHDAVLPVSFKSSGFVGGGQVGYNWQRNSWVTGIEADFDFADVNGHGSAGPKVGFTTNANQKLEWLSTLRGRIGFLATDRLLIFGTGGLAVGGRKGSASVINNTATITIFGPGGNVFCAAGAPCTSGSQSNVAAGWTLGGGTEWAVWNNTSFKIEYLYVNLGDQNVRMAFTSTAGASLVAKFSDGAVNILRVGINVKY
jgi:outer membrane immunogenic protein